MEEDEEELRFYLKKLAQYGISERSAAKFESQKYDALNGATDKEEVSMPVVLTSCRPMTCVHVIQISHISDIEQESADSERNMEHSLEQFFQKVRSSPHSW